MNEKWNTLKERLRPFTDFFQNKSIHKSTRITFGVVWNLVLFFIIVAVMGLSFAGGVGAGYFASLVKDEPVRSYDSMQKDIYNYEETSKFYFSDNVYLGKLRTDLEREEIKIEDVSKHLKNAVIATEDEYFEEHEGVVPKAILRAIFQEFTNAEVQSGGSTLTQQLIKNQVLTNEVSFERKAKEILLALRLERFFEKDEILEAYLNVATLGRNSSGRNIAGVQAAAQGIFGVDAKDLNIPQSAFIAGLPQAPFAYTPFSVPDENGTLKSEEGLQPGLARMQTVLYRMFEEGYLTEEEYNNASTYDIVKDFISAKENPAEQYPYLTQELENRSIELMGEILAEKEGFSKEDLELDSELKDKYYTLADRDIRQNGYEIHSTVMKDIYDAMQETKDNYSNYGPKLTVEVTDPVTGEVVLDEETGEPLLKDAPVQVGGIMIENKSGKILSFVGGRDFELEQINHATQSIRQNGSTMKPLLVYAPALEYGLIGTNTPVVDIPFETVAGGKTWRPLNYTTYKINGLMPARLAVAQSTNLSAARLYLQTIDRQPLNFVKQMGFSTLHPNDYGAPALSLGGMTYGVSLEENTNAYTTFANEGQFIDAYMIDKIVDRNGETIYEHKSEPTQVFSPQTAYLMLDMMRDTMKSSTGGTGRSAGTYLNYWSDWAGKSGTSQDHKDHWFIASNPNITFGTWNGYDKPANLKIGSGHYGVRNIQLWSELLNSAYKLHPELVDPEERFKMPGGIVSRSFCSISGMLPSKACSDAGLVSSGLFNERFAPNQVDDSLIASKYVTIGDQKYLALNSTPAEFSESGVILNPDFVKRMLAGLNADPRDLVPSSDERFKNILVAENKINDDGVAPSTVSASKSGSTITWTSSASKDVVGYRVYKLNGANRSKVASIRSGNAYNYSAGNGQYIVVAVDVAGIESGASNPIQIGTPEKEEDPEPKPEPKPEPPPVEPPPVDEEPTDPPPVDEEPTDPPPGEDEPTDPPPVEDE
ncbi:transglycosylase domain-containing protein [Bacillus sp. 2205SS5-2]|uniref:transglycosylase domain-containing protein n=1 Tax=Bacillus sp. 2205SS5-2 TaxID=3109031 RepID=UPI0030063F21